MRIALLFRSFGPYHLARLRELARSTAVLALEFFDVDPDYDWDVTAEKRRLGVQSLIDTRSPTGNGLANARRRLGEELDRYGPSAVAIPGWSEPLALHAIAAAHDREIPAILMSDSRAEDAKRNAFGEHAKAQITQLFAAALVAGQPHLEYLKQLGFPENRIVKGYDVVDNQHFQAGADAARHSSRKSRRIADLPARYFFCCARLIPKKNLLMLIDAFGQYRLQCPVPPWDLAIAGDGPERRAIEEHIAALGLTQAVRLLGHLPYDHLPVAYGFAGIFVMPSKTDQWGLVVNEAMAAGLPVLVSHSAGCSKELVEQGVNGYTFDPSDPNELAQLLIRMSTSADLASMGRESQRIISLWGPSRFAEGLMSAAALSCIPRPRRNESLGRLVTELLSRR
jgi:glycosyltransferase involved in cell wall biosynthesis